MTIGSRWLAILAIAAAFPARAGVSPNGMGPNGMGPNGMGPNGMGPNGMGPNGMGPNGMGPNGMGPNGMGPNGMGPNGMGPNGLDVNGMGPNGWPNGVDLGPGGLVYFITPDGSIMSTFRDWFEANPPERSAWMRYFARCAYDASTAIAYLDSSGKTWVWTGQYGLAMGSLSSGETITLATGQTVRTPMTEEEGKWVSACLLAHVNTKGTHQYLSVRLPTGASAPCPQAAAALATTPGEEWALPYSFGRFFADLFVPTPVKYSCLANTRNPYIWQTETVLGRTCDTTWCTYLDEQGVIQPVLTDFLGYCTQSYPDALQIYGPALADMENALWAGHGDSGIETIDVPSCATANVYPAWCTAAEAAFTVPIDRWTQLVTCSQKECLGLGTIAGQIGASAKLVGLAQGQAIDVVLRNEQDRPIDTGEAFTAIIRYTKGRTGAASVWAAQQDGTWRDFTHLNGWWDPKPIPGAPGPDVWTVTGNFDQFEWMQVWPVYPATDPLTSGGKLALKVRVSGATQGTSCTGPKVLKGEGEPGACQREGWTIDNPQRRYVCNKESEIGVKCRGSLVLPFGKGAKWHCVGDGDPVYACTAADAPDLDAAGFVPGRPWCAPPGATSFVGVCH